MKYFVKLIIFVFSMLGLANGSLPLELLEKLTLEWIDKTKVRH